MEPSLRTSSDGSFLVAHLRVMHMTQPSENPSQTEQLKESTAPTKKSSRKSILAFAVFALGLNTAAAVYTLSPSDFTLPHISSLAWLLPQQKATGLTPDPVVAGLKDIQWAQQQHFAALRENSFLLQEALALIQQDSIALASLRQSVEDERVIVKKTPSQIPDEHEDVKNVSAKISMLIAKVDSLPKATAPEVTSSIPTRHARNKPSRPEHKRMVRQRDRSVPVSVGGTVLSVPATMSSPRG
jgi:hypothetical protein